MTKRIFIRILFLLIGLVFFGLVFSGCFGERVPEGDKTEASLQAAPGSLVTENRLLCRLPIVDRSGSVLAISRLNQDGTIVRYRPYGDLASPVLGYLDKYGRGLDGIEFTYDKVLTPQICKPQEEPQEALSLSLDRKIQALSEKNLRWQMRRLRAARGCQIIMDLNTGHIIAMSNYAVDEDLSDREAISNNYALEDGLNPWGLVMNLAWLNGLERDYQELLKDQEDMDEQADEGSLPDIGKSPWHWLSIGDRGRLWTRMTEADLKGLSVNSSILRQLIKLGMGQPTGIDLPGEKQGALPVSISDNVTTIIDAGIDTSPIQLLCTFSSILQGGRHLHPQIGLVDHDSHTKEGRSGFFDQDVLGKFIKNIGDNHGPSIATVTQKTYGSGQGYEVLGMGLWPARSPKISYITVLENAQIDPERRRGTIGRTAEIARAAACLPHSAGFARGTGVSVSGLNERVGNGHILKTPSSIMPDLRGRSLRSALEAVSSLGLKLEVKGAGTVTRQYPLPGSRIRKGKRCVIVCEG